MILSNVNIGTGPSAGDGDPLRSAFTIINNNFQIIENNVNALTNSVTSVAGRTGNVILTINDIVGLSSAYASQANINTANTAMRGYVDSKITANIALLVNSAPSTLDTIRELADAIGDDPNFAVNIALSVSTANTRMRGYVDGQILAANAGIIAANLGMKGYVDSVASQSIYSNVNVKAYTETMGFQNFGNVNVAAYVTTSNSAIIGYIDQANTIQSAQVNAANLAIVAANLGMKGYVDSVATLSIYGNANVASYLPTYGGNIKLNEITFNDLSEQTTAWLGSEWRSDLEANLTVKPSWLSYYPGGSKNIFGTSFGFDSTGMFFTGDANYPAYPIRTNFGFHQDERVEIISTINFVYQGGDNSIAIFNSNVTPAFSFGANVTRIAFDSNFGTPVIGGLTTSNTAPSTVFFAGNVYTVKFVYDRNVNPSVTVSSFAGNTATGSPIDVRTLNEQLPLGLFTIGFDGDQDNPGQRAYFTDLSIKTYNNVVADDLEIQGQVIGNLTPSANSVYSLGNITHQWKSLFVSNNTIYVGGVPLSIDATGNLTVNGNTIPTIDYINAEVANVTVDLSSYALNANVTAANLGIIGYIDRANTIQSAQITSANLGIIGYIDRANTIQSAQLTAANTAWAANASAQQTLIYNLQSSAYSNSNVSAFLVSQTDQTIGGNLTIQGNLTVNGNVTYISVNNLVIGDNIINLADLNPADSLDLGFVAHRTPSGQPLQHTGLIRDANANQWRLFSNVVPAPGTTVDFTNAVYDDLQLGNITSPTINSLILANTIQSQQIAAANVGIIGYIDLANTIQSAQISAANIGIIGYIDQGNSIQATAITTANTGMKGYVDNSVSTANIGMKGYVDSVASQSLYGNINVKAYTESMGFTNYSNVNVKAYTETIGFTNYSNVNVAAYLSTNSYLTVTSANLSTYAWSSNVTQANLGMKGYVDAQISTLGGSSYGNANVASYLLSTQVSIANIKLQPSGNIVFADGTIQTTAPNNYSNVNVAAYLAGTSYTNYSNVNVKAYTESMGFQNYGNVNVKAYTESMGFQNYGNVNVAAYLAGTSYTNYSNVNVKAYTESMGFQNYGNVNVAAYVTSMGFQNYSNINVKAYTESMGFQNYGNVNVAAYVTSMGVTNYSNVNVIAYLSTAIINTTANISGAVLNGGAINSTGLINTTGNVSAATVIAGQFNTTGNVLAAAVVAGAVTSTGTVTAGNIIPSADDVYNIGSPISQWKNIYISGEVVSTSANTTISSVAVATTVDSYDKTTYRTAKYIVQAERSTDYESYEVLVTHNGTTAYRTTYGIITTGNTLGNLSATVSGSNVLLQYTADYANTIVRLSKNYLVI